MAGRGMGWLRGAAALGRASAQGRGRGRVRSWAAYGLMDEMDEMDDGRP